jgi:hypothetical protein
MNLNHNAVLEGLQCAVGLISEDKGDAAIDLLSSLY